MRHLFAAALVALAVTPLFAQAPTGVKTVSDVRKACQIDVPATWTSQLSTGYSPDKKITATVHGLAGQTFAQGKETVKTAMKPIKIVQDDAKRLMYTMDPGPSAGANKNGWYVVANTTPVCTVSFTFATGADEAAMTKIADSVKPVVK